MLAIDQAVARLRDVAPEPGTVVQLTLATAEPLSTDVRGQLLRLGDDVVRVRYVGPSKDRRLVSAERRHVVELGDFETDVQLAIALPPAGRVAATVGALARYLERVAKLGVAVALSFVAWNVTDPETGPAAVTRIAIPLLLVALILYRVLRR